jgi:hypothetical protein
LARTGAYERYRRQSGAVSTRRSRPHGSQTIVSAGSRTSDRVEAALAFADDSETEIETSPQSTHQGGWRASQEHQPGREMRFYAFVSQAERVQKIWRR